MQVMGRHGTRQGRSSRIEVDKSWDPPPLVGAVGLCNISLNFTPELPDKKRRHGIEERFVFERGPKSRDGTK